MGSTSLLLLFAVFLLSRTSLVVADDVTTPKHELNCTAILIEGEQKRSEGSATNQMANTDSTDYEKAKSIYDFTVKDTYGKDVKLDKYRGFVVLIVNIASQCGLTKSNYATLTKLHKDYYDKGLRILAFPCNQFNSQMPEADGDEMVCHLKQEKAEFGDVMAKINVNGNDAIPLYKYLKVKQSGFLVSGIKWNFTKFLVNKDGQPVDRFAPTSESNLAKEIEKYLGIHDL